MGIYDSIKNTNVITIYRGSTYTDTVTINQLNGQPLNLEGYTVSAKLKDLNDNLIGSFTCVISDAVNGIISRSLSPSLTAILTPLSAVNYVWGIMLTQPDTTVLPEIQGGVLVQAQV